MAEKIVVHLDRDFRMKAWSSDPHTEEETELRDVAYLGDVTPYGMLLTSLASCTGTVVLTYARYHGIELQEVRMALSYKRAFREDCKRCEELNKFEEQIDMGIDFKGKLTPQQREKLFKISLQCPIHKMLKSGITVTSKPEALP